MIISTSNIQTPALSATDDVQDERETRALHVPVELAGQRADRVLAHLLPEFSRAHLQQRIEAGAVRCGVESLSTLRKAAQRLRFGEQIEVDLEPTAQSQAYRPEAMAIDTVYVDEHLRVVNKPAGLVVHPAPGNWQGTLLNGLLALDAQAMQLPRAGIVHRLDKDTSGLMVIARTRQAMDALVRAIAARTVRREYLALAHRHWGSVNERVVDAAIGRDARNRLRMAVVDLTRQAGKPANTTFKLLHDWDDACLVHAQLGTGRTHQIRVHMAHLGHPLVGDPLYGGLPRWGMQRQALHAWRLALAHPVTGESMAWERGQPTDFQAALAALGWEA